MRALPIVLTTLSLLALLGCRSRPDYLESHPVDHEHLAHGTVRADRPSPPPGEAVFFESRPDHVWSEGYWAPAGETWEWRGGQWVGRRPGYVYQQGFWGRDGDAYVWQAPRWVRSRDDHVWVRGYWVDSGAGHTWVQGRWDPHVPGHRWVPGYWQREGDTPAWVTGYWNPH